ncbi:MAG: hypothetical protein AAF411_12330 [Myxococcota bacterium]
MNLPLIASLAVLVTSLDCGRVYECAGGTVVLVENRSPSPLTVRWTNTSIATPQTRQLATGEFVELLNTGSIGLSHQPNDLRSIEVVRIEGDGVFFEGAVESPPFTRDVIDEGEVCSFATYAFVAE